MNRTLNIIMPMCGQGSRFVNEGIVIPKQLLYCQGLPIFAREALEFGKQTKYDNITYTFIVRQEHIDKYNIKSRIASIFEHEIYEVIPIHGNTLGPGHTIYESLNKTIINKIMNGAILVLDCDVFIKSKEYKDKMLKILNTEDPVGLLCSFKSSDPRYSYAVLDENERVKFTYEKVVMSENALTGAYFFNDIQIFWKYLRKVCLLTESGKFKESYISAVFNELCVDNYDIYIGKVDSMLSYGTPEELYETYNKQKINAVITDFDGTLFDTREANFQAYAKAFWDIIQFDLDYSKYEQCFGLRFSEMINKLNLKLSVKEQAQIREAKAREYIKLIEAGEVKLNTELYDRLTNYKIHSHNFPIVLATTASRVNVDNIIKKHSLEHLFDHIIYGEDVNNGKPNPDVYYKALQFLYNDYNITDYKHILVFEDSEVGMLAAWNAGLQFEKITI